MSPEEQDTPERRHRDTDRRGVPRADRRKRA
jgi:hypothetical protein